MTLSTKSHENAQYFAQQTVTNVIHDIIDNINDIINNINETVNDINDINGINHWQI